MAELATRIDISHEANIDSRGPGMELVTQNLFWGLAFGAVQLVET